MDPVQKQVPPQQNQPNLDTVQTAKAKRSQYGRKVSILESCQILINKLINWLSKPLKSRKIKVYVSQNSHFSKTEFNKNCTMILMAMINKENRKLPELLNKLRLSIPAAIPHKNEKEIESSEITGLFDSWSAQCTTPEIAESLREDLLDPDSNIRKVWTAEQALM